MMGIRIQQAESPNPESEIPTTVMIQFCEFQENFWKRIVIIIH
jgi:hypothetical protein